MTTRSIPDPDNSDATARRWFRVALLDLFLAGIIGALLRAMFIWEIPFVRFRPWLHGHSHAAMLGWLFIGIVVVMIHDGGRGGLNKKIRWLLIGLQTAVIGMLLSFPVQGYGPVSITASSIHMVLAYVMLVILWRRAQEWPKGGSRALTRWSIAMFFLSTLGVWAIGPIIATGHQSHEIYYWSIQWFLHFQFNGWFWFAAIAMGVRWAERQGFNIRLDGLTLALWIISAVFTYALAIAWSEPLPAVFATVSVGVLLQVWAAVRTLRILLRLREKAEERFPLWGKILVGVALVSMALKVIVQAAVAIPEVAIIGFTLRQYVIGFIHLNTLATMTTLLLAYAILQKWWDTSRPLVRAGLWLLLVGIVASELLLFGQGTMIWAGMGFMSGHYWHLFLASALMPVGVGLFLLARQHPKSNVPVVRGTGQDRVAARE
jgi:hypothetical protein